jgi:hypothetical protein
MVGWVAPGSQILRIPDRHRYNVGQTSSCHWMPGFGRS